MSCAECYVLNYSTLLDALKSGRQSCYSVAMIVARLVIRYSANIYLAAICMRPNSRALCTRYDVMHDTHAYRFRKYTANSQHICNIYVVGNNLVQIDDNMCTVAGCYIYSFITSCYILDTTLYDTYCCYHSVPILTICTRS